VVAQEADSSARRAWAASRKHGTTVSEQVSSGFSKTAYQPFFGYLQSRGVCRASGSCMLTACSACSCIVLLLLLLLLQLVSRFFFVFFANRSSGCIEVHVRQVLQDTHSCRWPVGHTAKVCVSVCAQMAFSHSTLYLLPRSFPLLCFAAAAAGAASVHRRSTQHTHCSLCHRRSDAQGLQQAPEGPSHEASFWVHHRTGAAAVSQISCS